MSKRKRRPPPGARGPRGKPGKPGPRGEPGPGAPPETINSVAAAVEDIQGQLRVQFTRIAQLQAELDSVRAMLKNRQA